MAGLSTDTIRAWIEEGQEHRFYISSAWIRRAAKVRRLDRNECVLCRSRGRYARGEIVHHVKHLKDRPDLALEIFDPDTGERQLVTLCKACHERMHPDALRSAQPQPKLTEERWD